MSDETENQPAEPTPETPEVATATDSAPRVRSPQRGRRILLGSGLAIGFLVLVGAALVRFGVVDRVIKSQVSKTLTDAGIALSADRFELKLAPLELQIKNAVFRERETDTPLARIGDGRIGLSLANLLGGQSARQLEVRSVAVDDAELWVTFDAEGRSNFSRLKFSGDDTGDSRLNYSAVQISVKNTVVHYGDQSRALSADARNILFTATPVYAPATEGSKRFKLDLRSDDSFVVFDQSKIEDVDLRADAIADSTGADVNGIRLTTPLGEANLKGRIDGWETIKYRFDLDSTVDLTRVASTLPVGTPLTGLGNFIGEVSGEGLKYEVKGEVTSESLMASNVYLKGLNLNAALSGDGTLYEANGKAIAQMLTFEDFKIDFPQVIGLVRGTGTDFRWFGELQAAAAKTPFGTIGRLFLADAVAELREGNVSAGFGRGTVTSFDANGFSIENLTTGGGQLAIKDKTTDFSLKSAKGGKFSTKAFTLNDVNAGNLKIRNVPARTDVEFDSATAASGTLETTKLRNVAARRGRVGYQNGTTTFDADSLTADGAEVDGTKIGGIDASRVGVRDADGTTVVAVDGVRVARLETNAAVLGNLNIAGVRLTVRQGKIDGTSGDIDAGNVTLIRNKDLPQGGELKAVRINKPVFVLEPAGAYRASADMSLGGGTVGSIKLGAARAKVTIDQTGVKLDNLNAEIMDGAIDGRAEIGFQKSRKSDISANFTGLSLAKLLALTGGSVVPVEGDATGTVKLTFDGTDFGTASGTIAADVAASAGSQVRGLIPVNGRVETTATNGLFNLDVARFATERTVFQANGRIDFRQSDSDLDFELASTDANEIDLLLKVTDISPAFNDLTDEYQAEFAGALAFRGKFTGSFDAPNVGGRASLERLRLRGRDLGSVTTDLLVNAGGTSLQNGLLKEPDGGELAFGVEIPNGGTNNIAVRAKLTNINTGNVLSALPVTLPLTLRGLDADTSGTLELDGLPKAIKGEASLTAKNGSLRGQTFDDLKTRVVFRDGKVELESFDARFAEGLLTAKGVYETTGGSFDFNISGENIPVARIKPFIPDPDSLPEINGTVGVNLTARGSGDDTKSFYFDFKGRGESININGSNLGDIVFEGSTVNSRLNLSLGLSLEGQEQTATATIDFNDPDLPFRASTSFVNTELAPFIALAGVTSSVPVTGQITGNAFLEGNLSSVNAAGERELLPNSVGGAGEFTQVALQIGETPIAAIEPVALRFTSTEIIVQNAKFAGGGSNLVISGNRALVDDGINNLNINGRVNLSILNAFSKNAFFAGLADVNVRLTGPNRTARLNGTAEMQNSSASAFVGTERLTFDRLKGRAIFTANQVQIDNLTGLLGGGKFSASGGATISDNLEIQAFRFVLGGNNVTVPLPKNFLTTGDAEIEINGRRNGGALATFVSGRINAKRSLFSQNIDLADVIGGRREGSLAQSGGDPSTLGDVNLDLTVEGRNALVVRNNLADLTASLSLRVTGDLEAPQVEGRISADRGTLFYRNDRYETQRGELIFPPNTGEFNPIVNLQAETEINGYQIFVKLNGSLTDAGNLSAVLTSNPALPSQDVISLITTGSLSNTANGLPTLAQSGINTAAELLTDEIVNKPITRATDKLFGLNRFQIDPIISGQRNPGARLTVGRQVNRNLLVTYSTNLSEDQNQIVAVEYRVSNRLSFVAQYEQRSLTNVTRNRDNFNFEIRLRKRF